MLRLPRRLYEEIIAHGRRAYPKEACGILAGPVGDEDHVVVQVYPMSNVEDSPIGYAMDPREQLSVEQSMRQRRQRMVGIYHSHTATEAYPSSVDIGLAISPDVSYVLVSLRRLTHPDVKSYRIDGTTVTPEPIVVHDQAVSR
ncbi:MAG: M67 family metallopeptidase [Candidatus Omnitrophota bacterium]|nr:M67 family metallopeptidase [Candidatus Omnitrophota bacterium]